MLDQKRLHEKNHSELFEFMLARLTAIVGNSNYRSYDPPLEIERLMPSRQAHAATSMLSEETQMELAAQNLRMQMGKLMELKWS